MRNTVRDSLRHGLCALALALAPALATATAAVDETRLQTLAAQLRCPVCQNQSLADSDAELAADLREEIRRQLAAGRSDEEVRRFMVARYGDFVLYDPPLRASTGLLWGAPFALLGVAALALALRLRAARRRGVFPEPGTQEDR